MRLLFILALVPASLFAQAPIPPDPLEALVRDSPFLPATGVAPTAAADGGPLEFRSVVFDRGQFAFSIYDQASRQSKWVRLDSGDAPFTARSYDREHDILTVDYHGRSLALKLQTGHIAGPVAAGSPPSPSPLPSAEETARPNAAPAGPPAAASPQESQRLQDMANEIRRRRQQTPSSSPAPKQ